MRMPSGITYSLCSHCACTFLRIREAVHPITMMVGPSVQAQGGTGTRMQQRNLGPNPHSAQYLPKHIASPARRPSSAVYNDQNDSCKSLGKSSPITTASRALKGRWVLDDAATVDHHFPDACCGLGRQLATSWNFHRRCSSPRWAPGGGGMGRGREARGKGEGQEDEVRGKNRRRSSPRWAPGGGRGTAGDREARGRWEEIEMQEARAQGVRWWDWG